MLRSRSDSLSTRNADGGDDAAAGTPPEDALLHELWQLWQAHHRRGLEVRHQTGLILNRRFGPPTERQAYGEATLKRYSERLGVSESDLSRMRWFAHRFESLEAMRAEHPQVTSWTAVKELLASLRQPEAAQAVRAAGDTIVVEPAAAQPLRRAVAAIQEVRACVTGVDLTLDDDGRAALARAMDEMLQEVGTRLGIRYRPEPIAPAEAVAPPVIPAHDPVDGPIGTG